MLLFFYSLETAQFAPEVPSCQEHGQIPRGLLCMELAAALAEGPQRQLWMWQQPHFVGEGGLGCQNSRTGVFSQSNEQSSTCLFCVLGLRIPSSFLGRYLMFCCLGWGRIIFAFSLGMLKQLKQNYSRDIIVTTFLKHEKEAVFLTTLCVKS